MGMRIVSRKERAVPEAGVPFVIRVYSWLTN